MLSRTRRILSLGLKKGETPAIFGGGAVGLAGLLGARAVDAGTVIVVEPNAERGKLALELGATHVINPKQTENVLEKIKELSGGGVNYALDTTGIPDVIAIAVETMLPNGMLGLIAVPPPEATLPANMMSMLVLEYYKAGKFPFDKLIKTFAFDQINEAAKASESGEAIKPVMVF